MQPTIQNIVITANLNVPLDVKNIALHKGKYNERMNIAIIKIDKPKSTALIFKTGKMVCLGTKNESDAYKACFEFEKKIGFKTHLTEFRIQNITASCNLQFPIDLYKLYGILPNSVYEPELFPALTFRLSYPKVTFLIFTSGKIVLTGAKVEKHIYSAFKFLYPIIKEGRKTI